MAIVASSCWAFSASSVCALTAARNPKQSVSSAAPSMNSTVELEQPRSGRHPSGLSQALCLKSQKVCHITFMTSSNFGPVTSCLNPVVNVSTMQQASDRCLLVLANLHGHIVVKVNL